MDKQELITKLLIYALFIWFAIWGGVVKYFQFQKANQEKFSWFALSVHTLGASFAGLVTALIGNYMHWPVELIGALCAVAGHMGTPLVLNSKLIQSLLSPKD